MVTNYTKWAVFNIFGTLYWTLWLVSNAPAAEGPNSWSGYLRTLAFGFSAWGWILLCCGYLTRSIYTLAWSMGLQYCFCAWYFVAMHIENYRYPGFYGYFSKYFGLVWYFAFMVMAFRFLEKYDKKAAKKNKKDIQLTEIKIEKKGTAPPPYTVRV